MKITFFKKKNIIDLIDKYLDYSKAYATPETHSYNDDYLKALKKAIIATELYNYSKYNKETHLILINYFKDNKRKNSKINDCISFLYRVLNHYDIKHKLAENYRLPDDTTHFEKLAAHELEKLLNYMFTHDHKYNLGIALLLDTGVRISELLHIKYENIDLIENSIYLVKTKNKKPRVVFFGELTKKYIKYLNQDYIGNLTEKKIRTYLNDIKTIIGLERLYPHMLRKTFAMNLYENRCPILTIKDLLGHESLQVTLIYIEYNKYEIKKNYQEFYCYKNYFEEENKK